ncbi:MAG: hypothetical protein IPN75_02025 [Dechloromonas sp.]|uniref:Uncharacterized protein n=1 Tax=Candidatus Dechloromonas phosphorivorans TaxID=2899244 RepID=A0A9D7LKC3_9RHOO|nr:hypothetical protein [Candidatus Dechloromonas phosphorivorans]
MSKLDTMVAWEFFIMLLDHYLGRVVPIRFIAFSLACSVGALANVGVATYLFDQRA